MVLVMVPDIVSEDVQWAIVAVCLLLEPVPKVVLGDEVASAGVQGAGKEGRGNEIDEGADAEGTDEHVVEHELDDDVEEVPFRQTLCADESGTEGVEEDLESREEHFAEDVVQQDQLQARWEVSVYAVLTLELVVLNVVALSKP